MAQRNGFSKGKNIERKMLNILVKRKISGYLGMVNRLLFVSSTSKPFFPQVEMTAYVNKDGGSSADLL